MGRKHRKTAGPHFRDRYDGSTSADDNLDESDDGDESYSPDSDPDTDSDTDDDNDAPPGYPLTTLHQMVVHQMAAAVYQLTTTVSPHLLLLLPPSLLTHKSEHKHTINQTISHR